MTKANWFVFDAKFSNNKETAFQWFSYLLFCREINRPKGLFGYFNQSVLETEPVLFESECIGWQAKYYSRKLGYYTDKIVEILQNLKIKYPEVKKLFFYTNQLWGESPKGRKPKGLQKIDNLCKNLEISIEWKDANYFDSEYVSLQNEDLSKYFFIQNDKSSNCFQKLKEHTDRIIVNINSYIPFKNDSIILDRTNEIKQIESSNKQIIVLHGEGGCGKTAIVKQFYQQKKDNPFFILKAFELNEKSFDNIFYGCTENEISEIFIGEKEKYFVVDSAEKLLGIPDKEVYKELINFLIKNKWKIIVTTRNEYLDALIFEFSNIFNCSYHTINIEKFSEEELSICFKKNNLELPSDLRLRTLILNPFYLNIFISIQNEQKKNTYKAFKSEVWKHISNSSNELIKLSIAKAERGVFYLDTTNVDNTTLETMQRDGVITKEGSKYFISHDLFEEIAIEEFIDKQFFDSQDYNSFLSSIGTSLIIRRCYRHWLSEKYEDKNEIIINQSIDYLLESKLQSFWIDETLISVLLSTSANLFFDLSKSKLLMGKLELLSKTAIQLRLTCKEFNKALLTTLGLPLSLRVIDETFLKPIGSGWIAFIHFVFENSTEIGIENLSFILPLLNDWTRNNNTSETTREAGLLALQFYEWLFTNEKRYKYSNYKPLLFQIICDSSKEIENELHDIFNKVIINKWKSYNDPYVDFIHSILNDYKYSLIYKSLPKDILRLMDFFWKKEQKTENEIVYHFSSHEIEDYYGIESDYTTKAFPPSALKTPIWWLLQYDFKSTLDFLLSFMAACIDNYNKSKKEYLKETTLLDVHIKDKIIKQYSNSALWGMHRGAEGAEPYLLQSMHMALEKYLLDQAKDDKNVNEVTAILFYLLEKAHSVSFTSVVVSVVLAYPDKYYPVAYELFKNKEFFLLDFLRWFKESEVESCYRISNFDRDYIYSNERLATCRESWRKTHLEQLFFKLQFTKLSSLETDEEFFNRRQSLYAILENFYSDLPQINVQTEDDRKWRIALTRMDSRKMSTKTENIDGKSYISFTPKIDDDLKEYQMQSNKTNELLNDKFLSLRLWSSYLWRNETEQIEKYPDFKEPHFVIKQVQELEMTLEKETCSEYNLLFNRFLPGIVCSCLIRDFSDLMTNEEFLYCKEMVMRYSFMPLSNNYEYQVMDGTENAIYVLGKLFEMENENDEKLSIIILLILNLLRDDEIGMSGKACREDAINSINAYLSIETKNKIIWAFVTLEPKWNEFLQKNHELLWSEKKTKQQIIEQFIEDNMTVFTKCITSDEIALSEDDIKKLSICALHVFLSMVYSCFNSYIHLLHVIIEQISNYFNDEYSIDKINYMDKHRLAKNLALSLFFLNKTECKNFLEDIFNYCKDNEFLKMFYEQLIAAEDYLKKYEKFWDIWNLSKDMIFNRNSEQLMNTYLFALSPWNKNAKEWHSLKMENKSFFLDISRHKCYLSILYPFAKLLYGIGSIYRNEGINWIYNIISINDFALIDDNTKMYLEIILRTYIYENYRDICKTKMVKEKVIYILNFLINQNSIIAYMLRDNIL